LKHIAAYFQALPLPFPLPLECYRFQHFRFRFHITDINFPSQIVQCQLNTTPRRTVRRFHDAIMRAIWNCAHKQICIPKTQNKQMHIVKTVCVSILCFCLTSVKINARQLPSFLWCVILLSSVAAQNK
jgi:hypothetical protein